LALSPVKARSLVDRGTTPLSICSARFRSVGVDWQDLREDFSLYNSWFTDTAILLTVGSLAGRAKYFKMVTKRMYGRLLPKSITDKLG
jgi:hypothetical protein